MFIEASNKIQKCLNQIRFLPKKLFFPHILVIFPSHLIFFCSKVELWIFSLMKKHHKITFTGGSLFKGHFYENDYIAE